MKKLRQLEVGLRRSENKTKMLFFLNHKLSKRKFMSYETLKCLP